MFSIKDVAEYYDTTLLHYEKWWSLKKTLSLHYGICDKSTKTFAESLKNTNKVLLQISGISETDKVLDAGCGVGGAAFFIKCKTNADVIGVSLSKKQINFAKDIAAKNHMTKEIDFRVMDFTKTTFPNESFDVLWACESVCHVANKTDFIEECYRLLKKGGRLILSDFFLTNEHQEDKNYFIEKWKITWGVPNFVTSNFFTESLKNRGFELVKTYDYTNNIRKSARRLYYASLLGALPSELYKLINPNVSRFAKSHYKCGYYQYKALKQSLWKYEVVLAVK